MKAHLRILIDASGSMGYMKGQKDHENKYLLPDGSTRMDLTKKILSEDFIPYLDFIHLVLIHTFRKSYHYNADGTIKGENGVALDYFDYKSIYGSTFNKVNILNTISKIANPLPGGTPIFETLKKAITDFKLSTLDKKIIILFTDGDSNDEVEFDTKILEFIQAIKMEISIYIIGIDQDEVAEKKSKNLAEKTKGKYINLKAIDYDKKYINQMLFELRSGILTSTLNQISQPEAKISQPISVSTIKDESKSHTLVKEITVEEKIDETKPIYEEVTSFNIEEVVKKNSMALNIIGKQLEMITQEIKYIKSGKTVVEEDDEIEIIENTELNTQIGYNAEKIIFEYLQKNKVESLVWNNEKEESYKSFDMQFSHNNQIHYIECKGSPNNENYFYLTKDEWIFFLKNKNNYKLYYVSSINTNPQIKFIENLLEAILVGSLVPYSIKNRNVKAERILFTIL